MSSEGELTAEIGERLWKDLNPRGYDVLHDHGPAAAHVGRVVSWFGHGSKPTHETQLSMLDIAIVEHSTGRVRVLAELEESKHMPKTLLGDVLGTLMGEHITFRDKREPKHELNVGSWTTLIVMGKGSHKDRDTYLQQRVEECRTALTTANAKLGVIIVSSFGAEADLERDFRAHIERALA